ncbi:PLD nuclease N-terminal domain-containing protein [Streptomyces sp. ACA25]|uniref:PLD nuclease N-terminal domain-containing protein n=1 Tax=Streptomyces sp. ACA25 TaxID=3022596 RepID=UPI00230718F2|nr:PLD nuclease N-terminal domain-containing protein [Streptomyces sp. ACA25]MDB1087904.1 PLD nuclease N-terminal domain-containing protein [Streptomyces sp. ACA25]
MLRVLMPLALLALAIYALVDCISTKKDDIKHLPKVVWIMVIVLAFGIGPLAWILLGRERTFPHRAGAPGRSPAAHRPGGWLAPDDNPDFLKSINEDKLREENARDKELLESWEEDLRRREEDLRDEDLRQDDSDDGGSGSSGSGGSQDNPPKP